MEKSPFIRWFDEIGIEDVGLVGGKNASLGEMIGHLKEEGIAVPNGFAITTEAYEAVLDHSGRREELAALLASLDITDQEALDHVGQRVREAILATELPSYVRRPIIEAYRHLAQEEGEEFVDVAVRSSATAEDLPQASFAGQQETYLHIRGVEDLLAACRRCFASLFTNRAIVYRVEQGFDHFKVLLSIGVQKMVRSDLASSGVIFTLDTESGFADVVYITGTFGLGETLVQGLVNPDEFYVFKPTLREGFKPLIQKRKGKKQTKMVYTAGGLAPTKQVEVPVAEQQTFCLTDEEVFQLAQWGMAIEEHYSRRAGRWTPMDIEWAKDGRTGRLYIVQARPETVQSQRDTNRIEEYRLQKKGMPLATGRAVGRQIAQGQARVIADVSKIGEFRKGEVLVTEMTDPDWVPIMRIASAIVTNRGGRTSHAAIVSRELGLPCIVGTNNGTATIETGQAVTVSCAEGETGVVYEGLLPISIETIDLSAIPRPKTQVMINVGIPEEAFGLSLLPSDGVGLARQEFIINEAIGIHPMALVHFDQVRDREAQAKIAELTVGYADKAQYFVHQLAMGVGTIAAAFFPRPVILRFSDFKTNEYANLIGGAQFEPKESNPMIGWRGASRYYSEGYREGFALECEAVKKVRDEFGLTNLKVMVPVCRTPQEGRKVLQEMAKNGLHQGEKGLEVYVMCEIPSNAILADQFFALFDGFSIGSNDLTQMALGVDRDNQLVADLFDERNGAVTRMISHVIAMSKVHNRKVGICGDAPSTYPEFAEFLVDCGIDSISLSPDALVRTRALIATHEKGLKRPAGHRR